MGEILGVHIIGPEAFELIAEAVAAMESEATVETIMSTIHAHPTLTEAVGEGSTPFTVWPSMRKCELRELGRIGYAEAWRCRRGSCASARKA